MIHKIMRFDGEAFKVRENSNLIFGFKMNKGMDKTKEYKKVEDTCRVDGTDY